MILSFKDKTSRDIFDGENTKQSRKIPIYLHEIALDKLDMLHAATALKDLEFPPGNCLEPLRGDLSGKHSIRINGQYRVVFQWKGSDAEEVQIIDYH